MARGELVLTKGDSLELKNGIETFNDFYNLPTPLGTGVRQDDECLSIGSTKNILRWLKDGVGNSYLDKWGLYMEKFIRK